MTSHIQKKIWQWLGISQFFLRLMHSLILPSHFHVIIPPKKGVLQKKFLSLTENKNGLFIRGEETRESKDPTIHTIRLI